MCKRLLSAGSNAGKLDISKEFLPCTIFFVVPYLSPNSKFLTMEKPEKLVMPLPLHLQKFIEMTKSKNFLIVSLYIRKIFRKKNKSTNCRKNFEFLRMQLPKDQKQIFAISPQYFASFMSSATLSFPGLLESTCTCSNFFSH